MLDNVGSSYNPEFLFFVVFLSVTKKTVKWMGHIVYFLNLYKILTCVYIFSK